MGLDLPSCFSNKLWLTAISWLFLWLCLKIDYPQFQRIISISPLRGYYMVILEYTPFSDTRIYSNSFCMWSDRSRAWFSSVSESGVALQKIWRTYVELFESLHLHWGLPPGNSTSAWKSMVFILQKHDLLYGGFSASFLILVESIPFLTFGSSETTQGISSHQSHCKIYPPTGGEIVWYMMYTSFIVK